MGRPSQGVDKALLRAGLEELNERGLRGLSVRSVCARAGVSIRMLNYHFGTKDAFVRQLITVIYDPFFRELQKVIATDAPPLERLRDGLRVTVVFLVENHQHVRNLREDTLAGVPLARKVTKSIFALRNSLLLEPLHEAWKAGILRQDVSVMQIFTAAIPGVLMPCLWEEEDLELVASTLPEEQRRLPADPVQGAMQNFDWLMESFLARASAVGQKNG